MEYHSLTFDNEKCTPDKAANAQLRTEILYVTRIKLLVCHEMMSQDFLTGLSQLVGIRG